jgi:hypothetical protein
MRYIALVFVFATTSILVGAAFAEEKLKGTYGVAGITNCLVAPSGFAADSKGIATIANGDNSFVLVQNFQARLNFNGDGTGAASGTWMSMPSAPPAKAAGSAGTFSYSFTHTPVANNSFVTLPTPGTIKGAVDYGPSAGLQFAIEDTYHRVFQLSNDQRSGTVATYKPEVERLTYTQDSKTITISRICFVAGSLARLD